MNPSKNREITPDSLAEEKQKYFQIKGGLGKAKYHILTKKKANPARGKCVWMSEGFHCVGCSSG